MSSTHVNADDGSGERRRVNGTRGVLLVVTLAMVTLFSVRRQVTQLHPISGDGNVRAVASPSMDAAPRFQTSPLRSNGATNRTAPTTPSSLPVYLLHSATNRTARTTWGSLATQWNRTTQYADLFKSATPIISLPSSAMKHRPVVMIHCSPKTGSTTLRIACKYNLERTCGVERQKGRLSHLPVGYQDEEVLYPLMRNCTHTHHFCASRIAMNENIPAFERFFVHLFPFRTYDDWAASALKQQYDRGGDKGCEKKRASLEQCVSSRMELDFRKYAKADLAKFKWGVVQRMLDKREEHTFVLYDHTELSQVVQALNNFYGLPSLHGLDRNKKGLRPKGTCDDELLRMFHNCFSKELMELS